MYNATMNQYLAANHQMQITLRDTPSDTYGYRIASSLNFAGFHEGTPDGASGIMDLEVVYQAGQFQMIKRRSTTNQAIFTYAYKEDTSIQSLSAYVDVTEGQCSVGSQDDAQTGSNVVLTVTKADGSTSTHTIPITLDMLDLDMENRYIADTHTCSVRWGGMTLCTDYQLTVISNPDIPSAATNPVVLLQNNGLIFKEVNQLLENRQYVFVHNTEGNTGYAPIAQAVDNEVTIGVGQGTIVRIPGETDNYFQVPDPAWTWVYHWRQGVSLHDMGNMLYNGGMSTATDTFDYPAYATSSTVVWFAVRADVNAVPDTVVIDYGISVDIHVLGNDVVITDQNSVIAGIGTTRPEDADGNGIIFTGTLAEGFGNDCSVRFGTAAVRGNVVRYTPNTLQMTAEDTFYYSANYRGEKNSGFYYGAITVIPATTIYYEDSFVTFDGNWTQVGQTISGIQDEDRQGGYSLPKIDANNVYGHDSAYENMQTWSMGSVMKATVDNGEHPEAIAEFTFTGTGFDIISYTSSNTGIMMLTVQGITDPSYNQLLMVDSYYSLSGSLYQVPIMKMQNLPYGQYWVEVYAGYSQAFDHEGDGAFDFYLDAIRIYDPANDGQGNKVIENAYVSDKEGWPSYQELRNLLISASTFDSLEENDEISGVIFIDGNPALEDDNASGKPGSEINSEIKSAIADYANFGPNNELYLAPGQAVAFRLNVDAPDENIDSIHLGLKSVGGTAVAKVYNAAVNHAAVKEQRLSSATQQYYDITKLDGSTVVIWNVGGENDAILSVTDIKTTYAHQPKNAGRIGFTINHNAAAMALSSMSAPQEVRPQLTLKYPSLSFEGEICYNVYFDAQQLNGLTDADLGLAVFSSEDTEGTVDTAMGVIYGTQQVNGLYMATTDGIPAKNMGDRLYFKAFAKLPDGSYVYSDMRSYSAVDYAVEILKTSENAALKALAVAMLNYGAQAQVFFGYNTHSLMNGVLSEEDQTLVSGFSPAGLNSLSAVDSAKAGLFQANGGFTRKYPTVFFDGAFEINYNVIPGSPVDGIVTLYCWNEYSYKAADVLTRENADWAVPMVNENGTWKACSDQIAAKDMDQTIYAAAVYESGGTRYSTGILNYSIATYCQEQTAASDSNINALANAAATYGCAAKAYFH